MFSGILPIELVYEILERCSLATHGLCLHASEIPQIKNAIRVLLIKRMARASVLELEDYCLNGLPEHLRVIEEVIINRIRNDSADTVYGYGNQLTSKRFRDIALYKCLKHFKNAISLDSNYLSALVSNASDSIRNNLLAGREFSLKINCDDASVQEMMAKLNFYCLNLDESTGNREMFLYDYLTNRAKCENKTYITQRVLLNNDRWSYTFYGKRRSLRNIKRNTSPRRKDIVNHLTNKAALYREWQIASDGQLKLITKNSKTLDLSTDQFVVVNHRQTKTAAK